MNILVVDNETLQLKSIKLGLRTEGHAVTTALDGREALQHLQDAPEPFDLMLTDYLMPGINGLALLQEVKRLQPMLPVILMTAYGRKDLVIEALKSQCSGFIEKPFRLDQLLAEITRVALLGKPAPGSAVDDNSLAEIVHQINNPLMAIMGTAQLALDSQNDPETMKDHLSRILEASEKISEINRHIIELHKKNRRNQARTIADLRALLDDCLNIFSGLITMQKILLTKHFSAKPLVVWGDFFELQQAFMNLFLNAIEAMEGKQQKALTVSAKGGDESTPFIEIQITDTGCGVPEQMTRDFFHSGRTTKVKGSGLGLGVVRNIITRHGGRLYLSSEEGNGTVITVYLPATEADGEMLGSWA